jgi:hypothetical protein
VYRDRWDPYEAGSSLAVYGTDRFVAGSNISVKLYFFDFRYPKPYHYSTARPCSPTLPSPYPPFGAETGNAPVADWADICDHQSGTICNWHGHMRMDHWRPDGVLMLRRRDNRVHSLAKASDTSDSLYLGVQGSVMEMVPALAQDETTESIKRTAPTGWHVGMPLGRVDMIESGVSLCKPDQWKLYDEGDPHWHRRLQRAESGKQDMRAENIRCRLDRAYGRKINRERCGTFQ